MVLIGFNEVSLRFTMVFLSLRPQKYRPTHPPSTPKSTTHKKSPTPRQDPKHPSKHLLMSCIKVFNGNWRMLSFFFLSFSFSQKLEAHIIIISIFVGYLYCYASMIDQESQVDDEEL
jgi:hypothetical protein